MEAFDAHFAEFLSSEVPAFAPDPVDPELAEAISFSLGLCARAESQPVATVIADSAFVTSHPTADDLLTQPTGADAEEARLQKLRDACTATSQRLAAAKVKAAEKDAATTAARRAAALATAEESEDESEVNNPHCPRYFDDGARWGPDCVSPGHYRGEDERLARQRSSDDAFARCHVRAVARRLMGQDDEILSIERRGGPVRAAAADKRVAAFAAEYMAAMAAVAATTAAPPTSGTAAAVSQAGGRRGRAKRNKGARQSARSARISPRSAVSGGSGVGGGSGGGGGGGMSAAAASRGGGGGAMGDTAGHPPWFTE